MNQPGAEKLNPEARYANYFSIGRDACEILLEFVQYHESDQEPEPHTRIVTTPLNATRFVELLHDSLCQYEAQYGSIPEGEP